MLTCSIGIMAYNEANNIGRLLDALLVQELSSCTIADICVVASGCTDDTEEIVRKFAALDGRIRLIVQQRREGKASAINLFLSTARADIFVLISGDTIPERQAINKLVSPFADPGIGMTGARPVPVNSERTFMGFAVQLLWRLHHRISLENPKMGELVAFRRVVSRIPRETAVDEASIEAMITGAGLRLKYVGDAIVYNKGPETVRDFIKQRRRIAAGHLYVRTTQSYSVSTTSLRRILKALISEMRWGVKTVLWTGGIIVLEGIARGLGRYDFSVRKENPFVWDMVSSTKKIAGEPK